MSDAKAFFGLIRVVFHTVWMLVQIVFNVLMISKSKANIAAYNKRAEALRREAEARYPKVDDPDVLSAEIVALHANSGLPTLQEFKDLFAMRLVRLIKALKRGMPPMDLCAAMIDGAVQSYAIERFHEPWSSSGFTMTDGFDRAEVADLLVAQKRRLERPQETLELFLDTLARAYTAILKALPKDLFDGKDDKSFAQMPLVERLHSPADTILEFLKPFNFPRIKDAELFNHFREKIDEVDERAGRSFDLLNFKGSNEHLVRLLFPMWFEGLFDCPVPFEIFPITRLEHWHLVAPTGHGKSQTLQHVIMSDLMGDDPPAMVIIEPKGDLIRKIQNLAIWNERLKGRLLVVDPEYEPALNLFAIGTGRHTTYTRSQKAMMEASTLKLFKYVFNAIASDLTAKQGSAFNFLVRLMLAIPGATLMTFLEVLRDKATVATDSLYYEQIETLDEIARGFFENEFFAKGGGAASFLSTRAELARRINTVLGNTMFKDMFAAKQNRLDLFQAIQGRMIVAVNTSKPVLEDAHALFGRCMIAQTFRAGLERSLLPEEQRRPAWLIIDEAGSYFDDSIDELITLARSMGIGVLFAHQYLSQLTPTLRAAVSTNTTIKMAGGIGDADAHALARDYQTTAEVMRDTRKIDRVSTELMAYIRNMTTDGPVKITIPFGTMEDAPQMTKPEQAQFIRVNNLRLGSPAYDDQDNQPDPPRPDPLPTPPPPPPKPPAHSPATTRSKPATTTPPIKVSGKVTTTWSPPPKYISTPKDPKW